MIGVFFKLRKDFIEIKFKKKLLCSGGVEANNLRIAA